MTTERIAIARRMRAENTWETMATAVRVGVSSVWRALAEDAPSADPEAIVSTDQTAAVSR